jgi:hypothetical protein
MQWWVHVLAFFVSAVHAHLSDEFVAHDVVEDRDQFKIG